ncbi:MAG: CapA family protein [Candidatus Nomurabacteria bacterium]|nr:MAG: CapA family protein [Candidatus Nomurabacteria bacterium]HRV75813.1 CapA family protein [Candidatus Saccharimonadales bacterium]
MKKYIPINHTKLKTLKKPKTLRNTAILLAALIVTTIILSALQSKENTANNTKAIDKPSDSTHLTDDNKSVDLAMVGDMLPHETVTNAARKSDGGYDYLKLISPELQKVFKKADLRFCNQESVSSAELAVSGYPAFNAPLDFARDINVFGCNLISTANNHAADKGLAGIKGTLNAWDKLNPLAISGMHRSVEEAEKLQVTDKNGIKIGFTAFNEFNNINLPPSETGVNMLSDYRLLDQQVKNLREKSDVVIVSVHWGSEDSHNLTSSQKEYAKKIANLGADIIIGTGPHVWQPYQEIKRTDGGTTYLWNSIGNGLNSQTKQDQLFSAVALMKISKDKDGKITISSPRVLPTYMHYIWGSGVGLTQNKLLARKNLQWTILNGSQSLIDRRNDFKTTEADQENKLKEYLANSKVEVLQSY